MTSNGAIFHSPAGKNGALEACLVKDFQPAFEAANGVFRRIGRRIFCRCEQVDVAKVIIGLIEQFVRSSKVFIWPLIS